MAVFAGSPPRSQPACGSAEPALPLPAAIAVHVEANHIFVPVCVGGDARQFVLDTGAAQTIIDRGLARRLGLAMTGSFAASGVGAGTIGGAFVRDASLSIPGLAGTQRIAAALDLPRPGLGPAPPDGILGGDFLATHVVALDYVAARMIVFDPASFRDDGRASLPITLVGGHPHVDGAVRFADGEVLRGRFVVDVGASTALSFTAPFTAEHHLGTRVGRTLTRPGGSGVGGQTIATFGRVAGLRLGPFELTDVIAGLHEDSGGVFGARQAWVGHLGGEVLRRFTVYLDYPHGRLLLEPSAAFAERFEVDMSGLGLVVNAAGQVMVAYAGPETPATDAGIATGDVVVAVDGVPATGARLEDLRRRWREPDRRFVVRIRSGADERTVTLVTRRLV